MKTKLKYLNPNLIFYWLPIGFFWPTAWLMKKNDNLRTTLVPVFSLVHKAFCKGAKQIFFTFFYPLIFIAILGMAMSPEYIIAGSGSMIAFTSCIIQLPGMIIEFKQSSLLRRIGATKVKSWNLTLVFALYFFVACATSVIMNIAIGWAIHSSALHEHNIFAKNINWGGMAFGFVIAFIIAFPFGMMLAALLKNQMTAQIIGLIITVPGAFLAGQFLPLSMIAGNDGLNIVSYFLPQRWPAQIFGESFYGGLVHGGANPIYEHNPFNLKQTFNVADYESPMFSILNMKTAGLHADVITKVNDAKAAMGTLPWPMIEVADTKVKIMALTIPLIWATVPLAVAIKFFKWGAR